MDADFGKKLTIRRKFKGYSQDSLARMVGVSRQTIYKWEANIVQPNAENIKALCTALDIDMDYFYSELRFPESLFSAGQQPVEAACEAAAPVDAAPVDATSVDAAPVDEPAPSSGRSLKAYIAAVAVAVVLFASLLFATTAVGMIVFTSNSGDMMAYSNDINSGWFIFIIVCAAASLALVFCLTIKIVRVKKSLRADSQ